MPAIESDSKCYFCNKVAGGKAWIFRYPPATLNAAHEDCLKSSLGWRLGFYKANDFIFFATKPIRDWYWIRYYKKHGWTHLPK